MNRPSRTDDDLEHPTWNQNPPFLAPDLTTRQDLNGIANAREHRNRRDDAADTLGILSDGKHTCEDGVCDMDCNSLPRPACAMSGGFTCKPCPAIPCARPFGGVSQYLTETIRSLSSAHCFQDSAWW